jgi:UDP:flavonoid glycosyltransferase YjiC (YdhE family)
MIPLAWALRAAGHEVLVATADAGLVAGTAGLAVVDVAPGLDMRTLMLRRMAEIPDSMRQRMARGVTDLHEMLPRLTMMSTVLVDGVMRLAQQWQPDLVVQSGLQAAGLVAAGKLDVPLVDHGFGFARSTGRHEQWRESMAEAFDKHAVTALPERTASIDVAPPSLLDDPPIGWSMRYVPYNGGGTLPEWLFERADRPLVAVTLGTVAPATTGLGPVERIVAIAPEVDAEFVIALGDADTSGIGPLPDNVRLAGDWLPLNALLRISSALVHHGGAGSTLGALAAGVPQLVLPSGADRYINATAVRDGGAGLCADESDLDAALLAQLLDDDKLRRTAEVISAEIAALPAPADIVERLVALAR